MHIDNILINGIIKYMKYNLELQRIILKKLPKSWDNRDKAISEMTYGDLEMANYCKKLYSSLLGIKKYYQTEFDKDNVCTIDEYIGLFDDLYDQFLKLSIDDENVRQNYFDKLNENRFKTFDRFKIFEAIEYRNKDIYKVKLNKEVTGFTDDGYKKINSITKQLFMIEKLCSFTTRKFWKNELTKIEDLDVNSKFKILVKCVFKRPWRSDNDSKDIKQYYKNRIYTSASIIDENHKQNLFAQTKVETFAILIMDCEEEDIICASKEDSYSEELINNENLLEYKQEFTDVMLQDNVDTNSQNHKLYAEAVECETPKNILNNLKKYSEVNLKNAKPVGVICPNIDSIDFSRKQAEKLKVPFFFFNEE